MSLTEAQHARIDRMPDECRVVGEQDGDPVISHPAGRLLKIDRTGRLRETSMKIRMEIAKRRIERAEL